MRGRRLTEAARCLAQGAPDILHVALDAGYGSHEAFTRAFREQFGCTPEQVRSKRCVSHLALVEPIKSHELAFVELAPPRIEDNKAMLIAGLPHQYTFETLQSINAQWQRFGPYIGNISGQIGTNAYGVVNDAPTGEACDCEYLTGVEVSPFARLPPEFCTLRVPARRYAVFHHAAHVSLVSAAFNTIWNKWLSESGYERADDNDFLEVYRKSFDPLTGLGGVDLWIPIKAPTEA